MVIPAWAISRAEYALLIIEILLMLTRFPVFSISHINKL
jgi:hypothetical protein